jgi:D-serine deaminase-like pyridoxal phosphate-dependent protein
MSTASLGTSADTPALVLDRTRLTANLDRLAARAAALGVQLRPHLKTAKSAEVAALAAARGPLAGFTVSTLKEAEYFSAQGHRDLLYAVTIEPGKFTRAAALLRSGANLLVTCDHPSVATALAAAGENLGVQFAVLVEIDCGEHRSGIDADSPALLEIATALHRGPGTRLRGVCTHGGQSYAGRSAAEHAAVAEQERAAVVRAAGRLRAAGLPCEIVSVGSTPTALHAAHLRGVTELRCGVYMFGDLFQAGIGSCGQADIALSVLTAVIGHRPESNVLLIDAGALALSKDLSTQKLPAAQQAGYGLALELDGRPTGLTVASVHQEHGQLTGPAPIDFARFPIGTRLRILPNHSCLTAAAHDRYLVVEGGTEIVAEWTRINGW